MAAVKFKEYSLWCVYDSKNAKEVVREICISEDGDDQNINHTIKNLANKWSLEESDTRGKLVEDLQIIFDK